MPLRRYHADCSGNHSARNGLKEPEPYHGVGPQAATREVGIGTADHPIEIGDSLVQLRADAAHNVGQDGNQELGIRLQRKRLVELNLAFRQNEPLD
jgi:hypothetical protein